MWVNKVVLIRRGRRDRDRIVVEFAIATDVVSANPVNGMAYSMHVITFCQWLVAGQLFSPGSSVSSTNKTDRQNITDILLKTLVPVTSPVLICRVKAEVSHVIRSFVMDLRFMIYCSFGVTHSLTKTMNIELANVIYKYWQVIVLNFSPISVKTSDDTKHFR
jgi:hypothetical protein